MTYVFDLDNTLLKTEGLNYFNAKPIQSRIDYVNRLYDEDNTIYIQTARHERWTQLTQKQLDEFGIKCHACSVGKIWPADVYINDKGVSDEEFFK